MKHKNRSINHCVNLLQGKFCHQKTERQLLTCLRKENIHLSRDPCQNSDLCLFFFYGGIEKEKREKRKESVPPELVPTCAAELPVSLIPLISAVFIDLIF